jgi:hypothetical protein
MRLLLLLIYVLSLTTGSTTANCTDEETISFIEDALDVDVLYLTRTKGVRCRAKVSGVER